MKKRIAIIGSGDFAKQIADFAVESGNYDIAGFIDNRPKCTIYKNIEIIGTDDDILHLYNKDVFDCLFIGVGYLNFNLRESLFNKFKGIIPFANIIMPGSYIGKNVTLGEGVYIGPNTHIDRSTVICDNVFIHGGTCIGHDNVVNSHTYFSGRIDTCGFCKIGKRCFLGIRVLVADHIDICDDSWIGIGCIVAKNIVNPGKYMTSAAKLYHIE